MHRLIVLVAALTACRGGREPDPAPDPAPGSPAETAPGSRGTRACTELPFAASTPVPEASGAAWLEVGGALALVVISDSGNGGAYAVIDPDTGATREEGILPLGGGSDDLEGAAARGGLLHVISSPGWMRTYARAAGGWTLADGPYALGPVDLFEKSRGDKPPAGDGMVCDVTRTNCGRNYEGLCLAPEPNAHRCAGFAASKADGHLYCLVAGEGGRFVVERAGAIRIARPGVLADCAFSADGALYAGSNLFDGGNVYHVAGWDGPAPRVELVAALPIGFPETLAVRGDVIYRMSDTGGAPSLMKKYRCTPR